MDESQNEAFDESLNTKLFCLFGGFLRRDNTIEACIHQFDGDLYIAENTLVFTISALYQWVGESPELPYQTFRSWLYQSTLNQDLAALGAKVEVYSSSSKVDSSFYCLKRS